MRRPLDRTEPAPWWYVAIVVAVVIEFLSKLSQTPEGQAIGMASAIVGLMIFVLGAPRLLAILWRPTRPRLRLDPISPGVPPTFWERDRTGALIRAYHLVIVTLRNRPTRLHQNATATAAAPRLEVFKLDRTAVHDVFGQWVDPKIQISASDDGPLVMTKSLDIPPGPLPVRIPLIADVRAPTDKGWFLFVAPQYVDNTTYALSKDKYRIRLTVSGSNLKEGEAVFYFHVGPGRSGLPQVNRARSLW